MRNSRIPFSLASRPGFQRSSDKSVIARDREVFTLALPEYSHLMNPQPRPLHFAVASMLLFAIAVGIGRFAYTALIPSMETQAGLTRSLSGAAASANLFGYLAGALFSTSRPARANANAFVIWSLTCVVIATAMMAIPAPAAWMLSRTAAGIASGFAFVLGSRIVLERAAAQHYERVVPFAYGGVGVGIAATGVLAPVFVNFGTWRFGWLGFAALSMCAVLWIARVFRFEEHRVRTVQSMPRRENRALFPWLLAAYFTEGVAYIIPATFLVALAGSDPLLAPYAQQSWIVVGLAAAPSVFVWSEIRRRFGASVALTMAFALQALGLILLLGLRDAAGILCAGATLGGTFLGISAVSLGLARDVFPEQGAMVLGTMTAVYGVGQILGPLITVRLTSEDGSYYPAIAVSIGAIVLGLFLFLIGLSRPYRKDLPCRNSPTCS